MPISNIRSATALLLVSGLFSAFLHAAPTPSAPNSTLYRYKDASGQPVISHTLPDEAIRRGYEILTKQGRVLKVVPPALTDEERALKAEREAEAARLAAERKAAAERDLQLRRTYSHPDDIVRAMNRKLREMFSLIRLKRSNISAIESQLEQEQERAANIERAGGTIPDDMLTKMARLRQQITDLENEITLQERDIQTARAGYEEQILRFEQLSGQKRTLTGLEKDDGG